MRERGGVVSDCIFCKIIKGEIPSEKLLENEWLIAIRDIQPAAKVHVLIIPKRHIPDILHLDDEDDETIIAVHRAIRTLAEQLGVDKDGFRVVVNCGEFGGQTVGHLHYHLLGGEKLSLKMA